MRAWIMGAIMLAVSVPAAAQVPPDIAAKIRSHGQSMDPALFLPLYEGDFGPEAWRGIEIERDIAYGTDPKHRLDVFVADRRPSSAPVVLFVHGGGFVGGDKHGTYQPDNMTLWAARQGMVGVNINYRLAPGATWPAATRDLAAALAWTRANIARYGGDPDRIVVWGHSAGANHVADYVGTPSVQGPERAGIVGAVLLSPNYPVAPGDTAHVYYGTDRDINSVAGTARRLGASGVPIFLADAQYDPEPMLATARGLREGLCERGQCPRYLHIADHNHFTEGWAVGTEDQSLTAPLLDWMAELFGERG